MAVSCMRNASGHNYRNSPVIVDLAMGQIPRSTERITSNKYKVTAKIKILIRGTTQGLRGLSAASVPESDINNNELYHTGAASCGLLSVLAIKVKDQGQGQMCPLLFDS